MSLMSYYIHLILIHELLRLTSVHGEACQGWHQSVAASAAEPTLPPTTSSAWEEAAHPGHSYLGRRSSKGSDPFLGAISPGACCRCISASVPTYPIGIHDHIASKMKQHI